MSEQNKNFTVDITATTMPAIIESTISPAEADATVQAIQDKKVEMMQYDKNKSSYIKEKVFKYNEDWWKQYLELKASDDANDRRLAFVEYNKLQNRVLPTQITGEDGKGIVMNVINYGASDVCQK